MQKGNFIRSVYFSHWLVRCFMFKPHSRGVPGCFSQLSVLLLVSAQVMISWFMSSSPASGSALTAQSRLGILSLSSNKSINIKKKNHIAVLWLSLIAFNFPPLILEHVVIKLSTVISRTARFAHSRICQL